MQKETYKNRSRYKFDGVKVEKYVQIRKLFAFRYPKLTLLLISIIGAYYLFTRPAVEAFLGNLGQLKYLGIFVAGLLFSFGFTTPFAIGIFASISPANILLASIIGSCGALLSDLCIYKMIKVSFMNEFKRLQKIPPFRAIQRTINQSLTNRLKNYLLYFLVGFIIASPLPDEIGITMLAGLTTIRTHILAFLSFIFNTLGILIILIITN